MPLSTLPNPVKVITTSNLPFFTDGTPRHNTLEPLFVANFGQAGEAWGPSAGSSYGLVGYLAHIHIHMSRHAVTRNIWLRLGSVE